MSKLHLISDGGSTPCGAVVFVHGLGGGPFDTWKNDDQSTFWLKWLAADVPKVAFHSLEYDADLSNWFGNAMALPDRATNVVATLVADRLDLQPLVFVC